MSHFIVQHLLDERGLAGGWNSRRGTVGCRMEVVGEMGHRVRYAFESGNARHVDHVVRPRALYDVHAEDVGAECASAAIGDLAQFRRRCKRLAVLFLLGPGGEDLLDAEEPPADRVNLEIGTVGWVVALSENGV